MTEILHCPDCQATLILPTLPDGQEVQCPRCRRVFAPIKQRANASPAPAVTYVHAPMAPSTSTQDDDDVPMHDHELTRPEPLRGLWTAYVAMALLAFSTLSFGVQAYLEFEHASLEQAQAAMGVPRFRDGQRRGKGGRNAQAVPEIEMRWRRWQNANNLASGPHWIALWPTAIVFLIWICQASGNLRTLQARGLSHSPASAIFHWFVPILNLYRPYVIVQEIWRASHPAAVDTPLTWLDTPGARLIGWWWAFFLGSLVLPPIAREVYGMNSRFPDQAFYLRAFMIINLGLMVAGALLIVIIRKIGRRQQARYARLYDDPA